MNCPLEVSVSLHFILRYLAFKCLKVGKMNPTSDLALVLHSSGVAISNQKSLRNVAMQIPSADQGEKNNVVDRLGNECFQPAFLV